ncbi:hypothetical protein ACQKM9_20125 [Viridibacillus sp. NPDC093762]|uniref:hypothetical protein n=1 Tax=Viridibacillus sp. NPDC093762 TaxID=3390720 RepID=UPI003D04B482
MHKRLQFLYSILIYLGVATLIIFVGILAIADEPIIISVNLSTKVLLTFLFVCLLLIVGNLNDYFKHINNKKIIFVFCLVIAVFIVLFTLG